MEHATMANPALDEMFAIEPEHRLIKEAPPVAAADLPYSDAYYREIDDDGRLVFRYRLWQAFEGHVYGGERLDPAGNILERLVRTDRRAHRQFPEQVA